MTHGCCHRYVGQLCPGIYASEEEPTAAHISAANKFNRKKQPLPKDLEKWINVFRCRNAAKEDDLAISSQLGKTLQIAVERNTVTRTRRVHITATNVPYLFKGNTCLRRDQAAARGNNVSAGEIARNSGKSPGVGQFAAEIKAADEAEEFAERHTLSAQAPLQFGQFGLRTVTQDLTSPNSRDICGREEKNPAWAGIRRHSLVSNIVRSAKVIWLGTRTVVPAAALPTRHCSALLMEFCIMEFCIDDVSERGKDARPSGGRI